MSFGGEIGSKNRGLRLLKKYAKVASGENQIDFDLMDEGSPKGGSIDFTKKARSKPR